MEKCEYQAILNSLSEGVCAVDRQGFVRCFNSAAEDITGISAEEAVGSALEELFSSEGCACADRLRDVLESGGSIRHVATHMKQPDGTCVPVSMNFTPLRHADGELVGAVATLRDTSAIEYLRKELRHEHTFHGIVSKNPRVKRILDVLPRIAGSESPVLISGPTGSGKELFAQAIHNLSPRSEGPFVAVNCGALPEDLFESELFGYRKGAFTGAGKDKPGRFARAEGGTLLLDEVGDLPKGTQVKLLRVLEEGQYEPLGGTASVEADVRILAATNHDLSARVSENEFRRDLFYRLNVVELEIPPLKERSEDIPLLVQHFIEKFNAEKGRDIVGISRPAMARLMNHAFPGNVRELENIVEHAYIMCQGNEIQEQCLPPSVLTGWTEPCDMGADGEGDEKQRIVEALQNSGGHRGRAADELGVHESTLWRKMQKYDIEFPKEGEGGERREILSALEENDGHRGRTAEALGIHESTLWRKMKKYDIEYPKN